MKKNKDKNIYTEEYIKKHRRFPVKNTIIIALCVVAQIVLIFLATTAEPEKPEDIIQNYQVTVEPLKDGSLDIEYSFSWKAVSMEDLSWVEIGLANHSFSVYESSLSQRIKSYTDVSQDGYTGIRLDFKRAFRGGETFEFSFKINQKQMLCKDNDKYFYEFVPCWFNSIPVEKYEFRWKQADNCIKATDAEIKNGYYVWSGELDCGGYQNMIVSYSPDAFVGADTVEYTPFDDSEAYNQLESDKVFYIVTLCLIAAALLIVEIYYLDSHISYGRGRGFLSGYGHPIHTYGFQNPKYVRAYNRAHATTSTHRGGSFRSGGCACACACACAGGGRAGCSQKDTYSTEQKEHSVQPDNSQTP